MKRVAILHLARAAAGTVLLGALAGALPAPAQTGAAAPRPPRKPAVRILPSTLIEPEEAAAGEAEPGSGSEAIRRLTTSLRFLPEPLGALPESALPSPGKVLGHVAGAAERLDSLAEIHGYLRLLAGASDRVRFEIIGHSEEGREIALLAISTPQNLEALGRIQQEAAGLADPRRTTSAEAAQMAARGKVVCYLVGGLHAGEVSAPSMLAELAFRLAASELPELAEIRARAVVLITPVADPDGWERTVDWQRRHVDGTRAKSLPWEALREILSPPYLGHYGAAAADGLELALAASRAVHETLARFHPQLVAELAAISVPGNSGTTLLSLQAEGQAGAGLTRQMGEALGGLGIPGVRVEQPSARAASSALLAAALRGGGSLCTIGVFGNGTAGTFERQVGTIEEPLTAAGGEAWPRGGRLLWSLRDSVNLGEAAALAALGWAAARPGELLSGVWASQHAALSRGASQPPYAWLLPSGQRDPAALAALADRLHAQGVELHRLTAERELDGHTFAPGTLVVRADQPQRDSLVPWLTPAGAAGGAVVAAAAAAGGSGLSWPLLYGVTVAPVADRRILAAPMEELTVLPAAVGRVEGDGELFGLCDDGQTSLLAARLALAAYQVDAAEAAFDAGGRVCPPGSWIVQAPRAAIEPVAARFALAFDALSAMPRVPRHVLSLPRLALLHTWTDTRGAGWARLALDRDRVPYTLIRADDLKRGGLFARFDVILMPEAAGDFDRLTRGIGGRWQPLPYTATPAAKSLGVPDAAEDITGGFGVAEVIGLRRFVHRGGVLAAFGNSALLAVENQLAAGVGLGGPSGPGGSDERPPENGDRSAEGRGTEGEGAELAVTVGRRGEPLAYGYEDQTAVLRAAGPLFEVTRAQRDHVALWFGSRRPEVGAAPARTPETPAPREASETREAPETPEIPEYAAADKAQSAQAADASRKDAGEEQPATPPGRAGNSAAREGIEIEDLDRGKEVAPGGTQDAGAEGGSTAGPSRPLVLSGSLPAARLLDGKAAIVVLPLGKGRVVLFAFDPFRGDRDRAALRWVHNLLLNWNHLPE